MKNVDDVNSAAYCHLKDEVVFRTLLRGAPEPFEVGDSAVVQSAGFRIGSQAGTGVVDSNQISFRDADAGALAEINELF